MSESPTNAPPQRAGLKVLVVEDNPVNQRVAKGLISRLGHTVTLADNGLAAIEAVQAGDFDLIFMDIHMPVMEGHEATRRIRALPSEKANTPIVAMTAKALAGDREECLAAGMDDYLPKPVHRDALASCIEAWSNGRSNNANAVLPQENVASTTLLDTAIIQELRTVAGESGFIDLITTLLDTATTQLSDIEKALATDNSAAITKISYSLRGASANMGLSGLSEVAKKIEHSMSNGAITAVSDLVVEAQDLIAIYRKRIL